MSLESLLKWLLEMYVCGGQISYIHTYIHTYIHRFIHTYIGTYINIYSYIHSREDNYLYTLLIYTHNYIHTYISIHTYIQYILSKLTISLLYPYTVSVSCDCRQRYYGSFFHERIGPPKSRPTYFPAT